MKEKFNYIVHVWKIKGFVNINKKFKDFIKNQLLIKFGSYQKTSLVVKNITGMSISYFLRNEGSFTKISTLFRLTNALDIAKNVVEKNIIDILQYCYNNTLYSHYG